MNRRGRRGEVSVRAYSTIIDLKRPVTFDKDYIFQRIVPLFFLPHNQLTIIIHNVEMLTFNVHSYFIKMWIVDSQ